MEAAARAVEADPVAQAADVCSVFGALSSLAQTAVMAERFDEGERTLDVGLAAAERAGAPEAIASLTSIKGWMLTRMGRLPEALEHMDRSGALIDLVPFIEGFNAVGHGCILQLMGRLEESESCCRLGEAAAVSRGQTNVLLFLGEVRGHRALREGRLREAAAHYAALEALVNRTGNREPCIGAWGRHAVSAYLGCQREADARRVIAWLVDCAQGLPCRWPRIAAATGRALLAQRSGNHDAAEAEFRLALSLHEGTEQSIEEAETLLEYGAFLRRAGQPVRARPLLARALELAEASGATWIAGYVRAELAVAGGRRRRRGPLDLLTTQEQRVAELAATGLGNREIAERLSLSVATVETHLRRVYAKLEIHSRRELMMIRMRVRPS
jgi:DNA-binding CsgD family transcriptional regulator